WAAVGAARAAGHRRRGREPDRVPGDRRWRVRDRHDDRGRRGRRRLGHGRADTRSATTGRDHMRDLRPLFDPTSVAVVGASEDPRKWGNWLARRALRGERRRQVLLVNRAGGTILSRPAFRSLSELPDGAELVVIAVPAPVLEQTVDEALEVGVRVSVAIPAVTTGGAL